MKFLAVILSSLMLVACGGGGGGGSAPDAPMISGKVIDGYINGATVFWDCNGHGLLAESTVTAKTGAGGSYLIGLQPAASCNLMAYVSPDAVDEDFPNQSVGGVGYTLATVAEKPQIITPYTTLAFGHLKSGTAKTLSEANALITTATGLSGDLMGDITAMTSAIRTTARFVVDQLKSAPPSPLYINTLTAGSTALTANLALPGVKESLQASVVPFVYNPNVVFNFLNQAATPNTANIVLRASLQAQEPGGSNADNAFLDQVSATLSARHAADYGVIDFGRLDDATLRAYISTLLASKMGADNPALAAQLASFKQKRLAAFARLNRNLSMTLRHRDGLI